MRNKSEECTTIHNEFSAKDILLIPVIISNIVGGLLSFRNFKRENDVPKKLSYFVLTLISIFGALIFSLKLTDSLLLPEEESDDELEENP